RNRYDLGGIRALANAVRNAMTFGKGHLSVGIVSAGALLLAGRGLGLLFTHWPRLEERVAGMPTVLIQDGRLLQDRMRRENVSADEVMAALRAHGLTSSRQGKLAVLEVDGTLSVGPGGLYMSARFLFSKGIEN